MSKTSIKAIKMVYANTTKHDWPDDIWDAICQAVAEDAKQKQCEPVEWIDLTEEEFVYFCSYVTCDILLEIEAKLKEKNT